MNPIIVFVEHADGAVRRASLEAVGAAHATGNPVTCVLTGPGAEAVAGTLGSAGATKAVAITGADNYSADGTALDVVAVCKDQGADGFICSATAAGKDLAARVAAHLDTVLFSDCTGLAKSGDAFHLTRPWLAGKAIATLEAPANGLCATVRPNVFKAVEAEGAVEVITAAANTDRKTEVIEVNAKAGGKLDVKEAPIVVSGGRGMKDAGGFGILEELAETLGNAAVGASRAVVDAGWRSHAEQVGQTGKTVAPQLYIAVGISGAIQHLAGMRTSKVIVAINKDADAPIFKIADYGIVGDAFEIVPALTKALYGARHPSQP